MSEAELVVVFSTAPDEATAKCIASALVEERLAACVQVVPHVHSTYRWQGAIESHAEAQLIIKSARHLFTPLCQRLRALHPYEVPELLAVPAAETWGDYASWWRQQLLPAVEPDCQAAAPSDCSA